MDTGGVRDVRDDADEAVQRKRAHTVGAHCAMWTIGLRTWPFTLHGDGDASVTERTARAKAKSTSRSAPSAVATNSTDAPLPREL